MHRFRSWLLDPPEYRTQRNRLLPIEGGDGSTLNLDFTTGVLDPRLTFTRSTNATFINSSGLVQYAASNQQIYSQDQSHGTWVRQDLNGVDANVGATTDPQGGNTASKLRSATTLQAHLIYSTISTSISSGLAYTFSVYVKKAELKYVALHLASTARYTVVFDLDTGLMTTTNSTGTPLGTAYSSQDAGNGWWRLSATMITQTTTIYPHICLSNSATPAVNASGQPYYTGVLNDGVYTWGAQLNAGSTPLQYIATTTAQKFDQPRFDHDPNTGSPRGLLIEGSAVNLALRSNDFNTTLTDGTQWVVGSYTRGDVSTTLPDGTTGNACRISGTGSASFRSQSIAVNASTAYTFSFWARNNGGSQARYRVWNATAGSSIVDHTLPGSNYVSQIGGANNTSTMWVRVSVTFTTPVGCTSIFVYPTSSDTGTVDLLLWGAQVELGSGASSYIPTGASTGNRAADFCVMDGISSFFTSQSSLTMLIDATPRFQSGFPALWRLTDAGNSNSYELYYTSTGTNNTYATKVAVGGVSSGESNFANSIAQDTRQIMGYAIASGVGFRSRNGVSASAQIPTSLPSAALTRLGIGSSGLSANPSTAHIRRIKYWPYAMTQDQLNGVTTP